MAGFIKPLDEVYGVACVTILVTFESIKSGAIGLHAYLLIGYSGTKLVIG